MNLPSSKYSNNTRSFSGTTDAKPNDVILRANTSSVPAIVNLAVIPSDHWNTPWRLYVYDASNNASVNNITINAGSGQTINGASSLTINANGVRVIIFISSNNSFIALPSNIGTGSATVNGHVIADEGVNLPQQPILDFIGAGVVASNGSGRTLVTIPGGISQAYQTVEDEGSALPQRTIIDFVGAGVSCADTAGTKSTVTIPGGCDSLYATKNLFATSASYSPDSGTTRSVLSGQDVIEWSSKVEDNVSSFTLSTGIFSVATSGYYFLSARLVTRVNASSVDNNVDGSGNKWMTDPSPGGFVAIGIKIINGSSQLELLSSNKQFVNQDISDINIDTTCGLYFLAAGDVISIKLLNKTDHVIAGFANSSGLPDCVIDFCAIKIR